MSDNTAHAPFDWGVGIDFDPDSFAFSYQPGVFRPPAEVRTLESIRPSLLDPEASGPEHLYAIAMDVGREEDRRLLHEAMLLLGVVAYNAGTIGEEPVRSQGHVHAVSPHSGWSPPELFEIWSGTAIIFMQESAGDDPGNCYAVTARPGERVVVPPAWPHMVMNADVTQPMVFGALCDRGYAGFEYEAVRAHHGLAYYPVVRSGAITWRKNPAYGATTLVEKGPNAHPGPTDENVAEDLEPDHPMYEQAVTDPTRFRFVPYPSHYAHRWERFVP